ncbi:hypothetical protein [Halalkalibacter alkalisediminis]|uniref:Uncharacterized protein n=1 Tax=Halalkalibacter alkalisediminis TaxID=935616 RepID=A0ABV6NHP5_9BACI|nr:hypothetical protein [Halalkalibacter alkalisediminis]
MKQKIGNVGLLDLRNATTESIKGIERINNVGLVFYKKGNAHLLSSLNIGNIGKSLEIPDDHQFINGSLSIDEAFLISLQEPKKYFVNGAVIIAPDVSEEKIKKNLLTFQVNGAIYCPTSLSGIVRDLVTGSMGEVVTYDEALPRFELGEFTLTNAFLQAIEQPLHLVVAGVLRLSADLNMNLFNERLSKLEVKGVVSLHEEQEPSFHKKISSLLGCVLQVTPAGFQSFKKQLRLNGRSIKRFKQAKIHTKKPILLEKDITREAFTKAIDQIHTKSIIICHEDLEDLVYERCNVLDTEVITYAQEFVFVEGEQVWSEDQILAFDSPITLIVDGTLTFESGVKGESLKQKMADIHLFGQINVAEKKLAGTLQSFIGINHGEIKEESLKEEATYLANIGELSL